MATACIISKYRSYSDRGAFVQKGAWQRWEVDEEQLKAGKALCKWPGSDAPVVKAYDGASLLLEYEDKPYTIKVGEEVLLDEHIVSQNHGVTEYGQTTVKVIATGIVYKGAWQLGETIRQQLEGPIGSGEVWYPNGDHFKGMFHLSYARISGPAYAADGRYTFADGSYIEKAWINTSTDRKPEWWGLHGVFRVHHPDGRDSIAMFVRGKRYGFELYLHESLWQTKVYEWYAGEEVVRWQYNEPEKRYLEVVGYELDDTSRDGCATLTLTVKDYSQEYRIEQEGGRYTANQYDSYVYEPSTRVTVYLPNGDSLDHNGSGVREFKPYDGYVNHHVAKTGMCRSEQWKEGKLQSAEPWKRDVRAAKSIELPDPFGQGVTKALVWKDGHVEYGYGAWTYEGEMAYDRPQGKGVLTGGRYGHEGECYEGEFLSGRCHGQGLYVSEKTGIRLEGEWKAGVFQEPRAATSPAVLHAKYGHKSWSIASDGEWEWEERDFESALGSLGFIGLGDVKIARIEQDCITLTRSDRTERLTPGGKTISFYAEIEGREYSDGCVYDGDDYQLILAWKN